jgi:myo-inositol-1(or 4)-monophosphatase
LGGNLRSLLEFAVETAHLAGRLTLAYFQTGITAELKADQTPVTVADRKAEELIRARIEVAFPAHAIVGEEYGVRDRKGATHRWFVDPIDGTRSFVRGVPLYSVLLGLEVEGQMLLGVAYLPALDEMVCAARGEGCWWNGRRAHVSSVARLGDALVTFTNPLSFARTGRGPAWERIQRAAGHCAGWSDAYGYCLVATGRAELTLDPLMAPWDSAPFPAILEEAGGYFGDWTGRCTIYSGDGMATTGALLPEVLGMLRDRGDEAAALAV